MNNDTANEDADDKEKNDASDAVAVGDARRNKKPMKSNAANGTGTAADTANEDVEEKEKNDASDAVAVGDARHNKKPMKPNAANGTGTVAEIDPLPIVLHGRVPPTIPYFANNDAGDTLDNYVQFPPVEPGKKKRQNLSSMSTGMETRGIPRDTDVILAMVSLGLVFRDVDLTMR